MDNQNQNNWSNELVNFYFQREQLHKQAAPPVDTSTAQLEDLQSKGYSEVTWKAPNAMCYTCQELNDQTWPIDEFIAYTKHDAPIFSKSHVGCRCSMLVRGMDPQTGQPLPEQAVIAF